jgi:ABC-2 type transport system permease protein
MLNLIKADLYKMYKTKLFVISFLITTLCAAGMLMITYQIAQNDAGELSGIVFLLSDVNIISIIGAVVAGAFICGDFENKTIHDAISCGHRRSTLIIGKAIVFFVGIFVLLLPYAVVSLISMGTSTTLNPGRQALGFLNLLAVENGIGFTAEHLGNYILIAAVTFLVYMSQLSICVLLALKVKKTFLVVAIFYVISLLSGQLAALKGQFPLFDRIYELTPYGGNHNLLTPGGDMGDLALAVGVSLCFILVVLLATYLTFRKTEIK